MAAKREAKYYFRFRGQRGYVAAAKLRYARSFEIWYGQRRVLAPSEFPEKLKKVAQKRKYLEQLVTRIEKKRLQVLAKRRAAYKKRREKELRAIRIYQNKTRRQKIIQREKRQTLSKAKLPSYSSLDQAKEAVQTRPDFDNAYPEEAIDYKNVVTNDITVLPVIPEFGGYMKRVVEKIITGSMCGRLRLSTLDFTWEEENYLYLDKDNIRSVYFEAFQQLMPHIVDFFNQTKASTQAYILRLKFRWAMDNFQPQGISLHRIQFADKEAIGQAFRATFKKFFGSPDPYSKTGFANKHGNYLTGDTQLILTGFTMEGMSDD